MQGFAGAAVKSFPVIREICFHVNFSKRLAKRWPFLKGILFSHLMAKTNFLNFLYLGMKAVGKWMMVCTLFLMHTQSVRAQLNDNFSDGNFTANPTWTGSTTDWIVNNEFQLQSNNTVANSSFYLSTANTKATVAQWDFWVRLAFNPSGANYADVYLTASQSNLLLPNTTGYFIRIGDTQDEVSLYRKDANGTATKIIDGTDGILNTSNNILRVRVTRNAANQWTLLRDLGATGAYVPEGTATEATFQTSAFFGILVRQSTSTFFQRHYFDDIVVKEFVADNTPPEIVSANAQSNTQLEVLFNEALHLPSATNVNHYFVNNNIGNPIAAVVDASNPLLIRLTFANPFPNGVNCTLTVNGVQDIAGNTLQNGTATFAFYTPQRYDIVIHEIMVDPTPQVGLPNANWIELRNTSRFPISIQGYRLVRSTGISGPMPNFLLQPDSFVLVCTASQVPVLSVFGPTISVTNFPTLPNAGDLIWITDGLGSIMHAVDYSINWYQNAVKAEGGWTLEMIDVRNPCAGAGNWRASTHPSGGTPGRVNSIAANNLDNQAPILLQAFAPTANSLRLTFNEPLDSSLAASATYAINNGIGNATAVSVLAPAFSQVSLTLPTVLQAGTVYTVTATGLTDCAGNAISNQNTARVGLATTPDSLDLIVNEILFNPPPLGVDYLEVYNRSNKIIDAGSMLFTNRSSTTGNLGTLIPMSTNNYLIFPGEYYVLTENPSLIAQQFKVKFPEVIVQSAMPSFPNTSGYGVILTNTGQIVDELNYSERWHFPLIANKAGVALERIDFDKPTQNAENWTSAAQSAGFGTPGYQNSQFRADIGAPAGSININPPMFSPDNDGFEDFTLIEFQMNEPGYVANVTIYDAAGRPIRVLQRNTSIGRTGSFRWDGLNDKQQRVPVGNYIVLFEAFNLQGSKQVFKKGVTVARKFN